MTLTSDLKGPKYSLPREVTRTNADGVGPFFAAERCGSATESD